MNNDPEVYTPSEWPSHHDFYDGFEDRTQRKAVALIHAFGTAGGGDKVAFVGPWIVIASPAHPQGADEVELVVRDLKEFVADFATSVRREVDPEAMRWVEDITDGRY
jgi:hypothetical protein